VQSKQFVILHFKSLKFFEMQNTELVKLGVAAIFRLVAKYGNELSEAETIAIADTMGSLIASAAPTKSTKGGRMRFRTPDGRSGEL
jgi:hypothetical protein